MTLVERCPHESETPLVLEFSAGLVSRRYVSCGLPGCNDQGVEWLNAQGAGGTNGEARTV